MEHQSAAGRRFVERYLLGELSPDEAAEFEAHFFECATCAAEVRQGAYLTANLKAVLQDSRADPPMEVRAIDRFLDLTIALDEAETVPRIECVFRFEGVTEPLVIAAFAGDGSIRLRLPADRFPAGPCTVVLRDKDSRRELGRRRLSIVK